MKGNQPPKVATWLLRHFGSSPNIEAIVGDLDERYGQGRSRLWYWRQALPAIVTGFCQEVWGHKLLAVRALFLGWIIKAASLWLALVVALTVCNNPSNSSNTCRIVFGGHWQWQWFLPSLMASITASVVMCIMSVRLVSRISGPHYRSMVLLYILVELLAVPVMINAGSAYPLAGVVVLIPGGFSLLWAAPFATYFYVGLAKLGYPFETVFSLWFGCTLMALTMLMAGRIFSAPAPDSSQGQRGVTGDL